MSLYVWNGFEYSPSKCLVEFTTIKFKVVVATLARNLKGHTFLVDVPHNLLDRRLQNFYRFFNLINRRKVLNSKNLFERFCNCCVISSIEVSVGTVAICCYLNLGIDRQNVRNIITKFIDETHTVFTLG
ncbi:Uncharacterised protein [Streptococcus pneumoniae]|nr:Uncharacterised protein [Streptococcus pneumoniae]